MMPDASSGLLFPDLKNGRDLEGLAIRVGPFLDAWKVDLGDLCPCYLDSIKDSYLTALQSGRTTSQHRFISSQTWRP